MSLQYIAKALETKISTLVIDQAVSLAIEINDDTKITFEESTGIAIYSNSESKISSSLTIFETLWIQSEIDIQNKVKQAYFQCLRGFNSKTNYILDAGHSINKSQRKTKTLRNKKAYYHDHKTVVVASDICISANICKLQQPWFYTQLNQNWFYC